jgi:hypothetical protein
VSDKVTIVLAVSKATKIQQHILEKQDVLLQQTFCDRRFRCILHSRNFLGHFQGSIRGVVSPLDVDEPESNKSNTRAKAGVVLLPRTKVDDVFFLEISMPMGEVFSAMPSPDDCATNFLLGFKGLARASSRVEI